MGKIGVILTGMLLSFSVGGADTVIKFKAEDTVTHLAPPETQGAYFIKGDKSYIEAVSAFSLRYPELKGWNFEATAKNITRLDLGVTWAIIGDDEYAEIKLHTAQVDSIDKAAEYTWAFSVSPIEESKKFKKLVCGGQIGKAVGVSNNDPADTVFISFEQWQTNDTLIGTEFCAYLDRYAAVTGRHRIWAQRHIVAYLRGEYRTIFERLSDMMNSAKSIP